jgi:hypothetical protein
MPMAPWRSGYAEVCKTFHTGSIPVGASTCSLSLRQRVLSSGDGKVKKLDG